MGKRARHTTMILSLCVTVAATSAFMPVESRAQTLESARESYEQGNFTEAENELREILAVDSENNEALSLLREIELRRRKEEAAALTGRALIEINSRKFQEAYALLERALILDPENRQARELYLSIHEVLQVEGETVDEVLRRGEEEGLLEEAETGPVTEASPEEEEVSVSEEKPPAEKKMERRYDKAFIRGGPVFSFDNSTNLDYIKSNMALFGLRLDGRYYFNFLQRRLGLSFDYTGSFVKLSGDELINFGTNRMNFSVRYRMYFFERDYGSLTLGVRLNYHLFLLNNREPLGVYYFTRVYGPSIGLFFEDPIIYRFWKKEFFRNIGFEGDFNYLLLIGQGKEAPRASEWSLGMYYDLNRYRFSIGYRRYTLRNDSVRESYNDIEIMAGYRF